MDNKKLLVKSAPAVPCPKEGKPREYISEAVFEEVADSSYYRRRIADGSLIERAAESAPQQSKKPEKGAKK